jgi:Family of unknown function (DUF6335)
MKGRPRRKARDERRKRPVRLRPVAESGHHASPTAVAAEALRTGVLPKHTRRREETPRASELLLGDPDDHLLANAYVGDETPGGTSPTPDQNGVDEIGRAYGLQEEDSGSLRSAAEVLSRRDRHRDELQPPRRPQP